MVIFEAVDKDIFTRNRDLAMGIRHDAQILQERVAKGRDEVGTVWSDADGKELLQTFRELFGVACLVGKQVLLVARNGVYAAEEVIRVGTVGPWSAGIIGVPKKVKGELALGRAGIAKIYIRGLVSVVIVGDNTAGIET